jgi:hypothetical protein
VAVRARPGPSPRPSASFDETRASPGVCQRARSSQRDQGRTRRRPSWPRASQRPLRMADLSCTPQGRPGPPGRIRQSHVATRRARRIPGSSGTREPQRRDKRRQGDRCTRSSPGCAERRLRFEPPLTPRVRLYAGSRREHGFKRRGRGSLGRLPRPPGEQPGPCRGSGA